ncbi:CD302 antigen isoform X3 [Octodon degus]|uniref:CD302 antigen isoform X3 n=1 Tax=Octodon degus TaxID=10160 RepID=A0A6P6EB52_OCTDE|nr:CD302 antigen isoform X3 [Octodon degus]
MPRAVLSTLLLPLLGLTAATVSDCPSSTWIQFQGSCYIFLQEAIKVEGIEDVRSQCTGHDASFKWFDNSNMTFDNWADQDEDDLVDTCGFLHTKTGEWKKGNCEISSVEGTLCKAAIPYDKKYLSDNHILVTTLVAASTVIFMVLGAIIWFFYKRHTDSGFTTVFSTTSQSPFNDDCVLVAGEESEYAVQFD